MLAPKVIAAVIEPGATAEGGKDDHVEGMFASEGPGRLGG
jgi:hypothetical protein